MKSSRLFIAAGVAALLPLAGAFAQSPTPPAEEPAQPAQQGATFESLDANSDDAQAVAQSLDELSIALTDFHAAVDSGPQLDDLAHSLDSLRIGILALLAWLGALALGAVAAGIGCWVVARGD